MIDQSTNPERHQTNDLSNSNELVAESSEQPTQLQDIDPTFSMYFSVSLQKLIVMNLVTLGIYQIYWMYKNWWLVKIREGSNIWPFLRSFPFPMFFFYFLLKRIRTTGDLINKSPSFSPMPTFLLWLIGGFIAGLFNPILCILVYVLALCPVQTLVNEINKAYNPNIKENSSYSALNILAIVIGGFFVIANIIGLLGAIYKLVS